MPQMNSVRAVLLATLAGLALGFGLPPRVVHGRGRTPADTGVAVVKVEEVLRSATTTSGDPIRLPNGAQQIVASRYRILAGAALPVHKHLYPRYGYVLAGAIEVVNVEVQQSRLFRTGDVIVEDVDTWHRASVAGPRPVELLVIDFVPPGTNNVVPASDQAASPSTNRRRHGRPERFSQP